MKTRVVDLKPWVDQLRSYVPPLKKIKSTDEKKEGINKIIFGELPVKVECTHDSKMTPLSDSSLEVVMLQAKTKQNPILFHHAIECLRHATRYEIGPSKWNNRVFSQVEIKGVHSPFIQKYLYQGSEGRVTQRREGDLVDCMNRMTREKFLKLDFKEIFAQMLLAVYELHRMGLVHRDIKPDNFLVEYWDDHAMHLELADLESVTTEHAKDFFLGSPMYIAPEHSIKNPKPNKKAVDCYALGITMAKLVEWQGNWRKILMTEEKCMLLDDIGQFNVMIDGFTHEDPKKRLTIVEAMQLRCFGKTHQERVDYFNSIIKKFNKKEIYYDSYYQGDDDYYPEKNDAFLLLPVSLKEIYQEAASLDDCIKICEDSPHSLVINAIQIKADKLSKKIHECLVAKCKLPYEIITGIVNELVKISDRLDLWKARLLNRDMLRSVVDAALEEYVVSNKFDQKKQPHLWNAHNKHGLIKANNFRHTIEKYIQQQASVQVITRAIYEYQRLPGKHLPTSFKTILAKTFKEQCGFELARLPVLWSHMPNNEEREFKSRLTR